MGHPQGLTRAVLRRRDRGEVSVEYALVALFIAIAVLMSMLAFGSAVLGLFDTGVHAPWDGTNQ